MRNRSLYPALAAICCLVITACSINKMAVNAVSDALTKKGNTDVFMTDSDPLLVGEALPFVIKMYEALVNENPKHRGLLKTTGTLFVMYANAFVQKPAEQLPRGKYDERQAAMKRAKGLYLRGLGLLYRGLELGYPGFERAFQSDGPHNGLQSKPQGNLAKILAKMKKDDVPFLYWAAAGGFSAFSINPMDIDLGLRIPEFFALVQRAYELDPDFGSGALDDFFLLFYALAPGSMGGDKSKAEVHFKRALEKSGGRLAGPYVSYAQAVSIPAQDYDTFKACLEAALAIDPDADPQNRLINIISRRKAQYLLEAADLFFFNLGTQDDWSGEDSDEDW